jgi:hypothetical protein
LLLIVECPRGWPLVAKGAAGLAGRIGPVA